MRIKLVLFLMKNFILFLLMLLVSNLYGQLDIPSSSPFATVSQKVGRANVSIEYSRPAIKGRLVFGGLVPYGKVWRTGANKITKVTFDQALQINGSTIKPGSYGLFTIPNEDSWKVILNRDSDIWGAYEYNPKNDVISFEVTPLYLDHREEFFTIEFAEFTPTTAKILISWERTAIEIPIGQDLQKIIMDEIAEATSDSTASSETFFIAASYYNENNYDLEQALVWAQKSLGSSQNYWNYEMVARIASKLGKCDLALENAKKSMEMAEKANDNAYVLLNKNTISSCIK